jgi:enoyl-CoA hydratase/carnithine racemase
MAISYEKDGKVAIFTINRPEAMNALDMETIRQMRDAMMDFRDDPGLWVGIVTGAGPKAFCAGADIKDTLSFMKEHRRDRWSFPKAIWRGLELWKPLIAAVNGVALGGGLEVVLACDIRVAAETARFGVPEVTLGLVPDFGATQRLPRMLPWSKAAEMLLTGRAIDAQEAYRIGLVNKVVPAAQVMPEAMEYANAILQAAPLAVRAAKEAMIKGTSLSLDDGLRLENALNSYLYTTDDFAEGTGAFLEKRKPAYRAK